MVETEFPQNKNELQSHKSRRLTEEFNSMIQFQKCMKGVLKLYSGTFKKRSNFSKYQKWVVIQTFGSCEEWMLLLMGTLHSLSNIF